MDCRQTSCACSAILAIGLVCRRSSQEDKLGAWGHAVEAWRPEVSEELMPSLPRRCQHCEVEAPQQRHCPRAQERSQTCGTDQVSRLPGSAQPLQAPSPLRGPVLFQILHAFACSDSAHKAVSNSIISAVFWSMVTT